MEHNSQFGSQCKDISAMHLYDSSSDDGEQGSASSLSMDLDAKQEPEDSDSIELSSVDSDLETNEEGWEADDFSESEEDIPSISIESNEELSSLCSEDVLMNEVACSPDRLFDNSQIDAHHFGVLFLSLAQRNNLTLASQSDILKLVQLILPIPNKVPSSHCTLQTCFVETSLLQGHHAPKKTVYRP